MTLGSTTKSIEIACQSSEQVCSATRWRWGHGSDQQMLGWTKLSPKSFPNHEGLVPLALASGLCLPCANDRLANNMWLFTGVVIIM